ncbi:uncharacterized protein LOC119070740 isoform X2 [Bradysia coprophila]|uniref:uncharacterized protein LOC119070740 isoform X2 n=1 Tax=Bradysia coprophila TaxID=38358 RepID=UPI00187DCC66|nr:uncharacterized protein LOC119070740 isoform X2 [Bradysia coprophila]
MEENDRSSRNAVGDVDSLLKQLGKTFTEQRTEISNLEHSLRISQAEGAHLRIECHKWKSRCDTITKFCISHIGSLDTLLESYANTDTSNTLSEVSLARSCNAMLVDQVTDPKSVPPNCNKSRQNIKSFQSKENRSLRRNDESNNIDELEGADNEENFGSYDHSSDEEIGRTGESYDETNGQRETSDQESCVYVEQSDVEIVSVVDSDDDSENEPVSVEQSEANDDANYNSSNSDSVEQRVTANDCSTVMSDGSIVLQKQLSRELFLKQYLTAYADKPFQCDLCKSEFRSRRNVERHKNNRVCKMVATAITNSNRKTDAIDYADHKKQPLRGPITSNNNKRKTVLSGAGVQPPAKIKLCKIENSKLTK